jgi:hypothetical protein
MFSDLKYNQYSNNDLSVKSLVKILGKQIVQYPFLDLYFFNPTHNLKVQECISLMKEIGFRVSEFYNLDNFDLEQYICYNELENYDLLKNAFVKHLENKRQKKDVTLSDFM